MYIMLVLIFHALIRREFCRDDRRHRSFVLLVRYRLFVLLVRYRLFVIACSFSIVCLSPAYYVYHMRDAEMNFLVTYELDLACNVVFCILSALR